MEQMTISWAITQHIAGPFHAVALQEGSHEGGNQCVSVSPTDRSQLCQMNWGLPLRWDGISILQLLGFPALFGHRRLSSYNDWSQPRSRAVPVESPQCSADMCVDDETVRLLGPFCCEELGLPLDLVHIVCACVTPSSCTAASSSSAPFVDIACCWHCSFHPLWVRSSQFSVSITLRVVLNLDHASRRSGPRSCIASFWTSIMHRIVLDLSICLLASCLGIISVMFLSLLASRWYSSSSVLLRAA